MSSSESESEQTNNHNSESERSHSSSSSEREVETQKKTNTHKKKKKAKKGRKIKDVEELVAEEEQQEAEKLKKHKNILKKVLYSFVPEPGTESHRSQMGTAGWLRAGVLGANDAIVSVAAVMVGVAANTDSSQGAVLTAGLAALVAGAFSMAVGEYVSVSSQRDLEHADLKKEKWELEHNWDGEIEELSLLYQERGVDEDTASEVAKQLMEKDALQAHAMDELGIRDFTKARPFMAGFSSFMCFMIFGTIPFIASVFVPNRWACIGVLVGITLIMLAISGAIGSYFGGAPLWKGALRVTIGGFIALAITFGVGVAVDYSGAGSLSAY